MPPTEDDAGDSSDRREPRPLIPPDVLERIRASWQLHVEQIERIRATLQPQIEKLLAPAREFAARWPAIEQRIREFPGKTRLAFNAAGLPPSARLSLDDLTEIVRRHERGDHAGVREHIEELYREFLADDRAREQLLADWAANPLVTDRLPILRHAMEAGRLGLYGAAIPPLLAQLEGVVASARGASGWMGQKQYGQQLTNIASADEFFGQLADDFVTQVLLSTFAHGAAPSSTMSRHAILHGGDAAYATERNWLSAVMLFDYFQELIRETLTDPNQQPPVVPPEPE